MIVSNLRKAKGMSLDDLAQILKVSQSQVCRLENGRQSFKTEILAKLGKALNYPPFAFLMTEKEWTQYLAGRKKF